MVSVGLVNLACSGLLPGARDAAVVQAPDVIEAAEAALAEADYTGAEAILNARLKEAPDDAHTWRMLGDVNLVRGQHYKERWKENLGWAVDAYAAAVKHAPEDCAAWARLGAVVISAAENPATKVPREVLDALPLDAGGAACPAAGLLAVEFARAPSPDELDAVARRIGAEASGPEALAVAAPWMAAASRRYDAAAVEWGPGCERPPLAAGVPFVVTELPVTGASVDGSEPRRFSSVEWVTPTSVSAERLVYVDRRFPKTVAERAVTRAPGCPGTRWELQGSDRIPTGSCVAGGHDRRASELYDPARLRVAGAAHFHQPSIAAAAVDWDTVAGAVTCVGGPVGRMFVDVPSCPVSYDRAIHQTRSIPRSSGLPAWSVEHAEAATFAGRAGKLVGEDVAKHLVRGEVGAGLPYTWFAWTQPELPGCRGRGVFQKLARVDGGLEFSCAIRGKAYKFRDLVLVEVSAAAPE